MATFGEANQARLSLKMTLSNYSWYAGSGVQANNGDWGIVIHTSNIDNKIRKVIPIVHNGVSVKTEVTMKKSSKAKLED